MFYREVYKLLGCDTFCGKYVAHIIAGVGVYIQGKVDIAECSSVKVALKVNKQGLIVTGEKLTVQNLDSDEIAILGKINNIVFG